MDTLSVRQFYLEFLVCRWRTSRMISDVSKLTMESARSLGHDWNPLQKFIY